jgi:GDP-L-fucose synthase
MSSNILVTGGNGLLGHCIDFGIKPTRSQLDLYNFDQLCHFIENNNVSKLVHLAAKVGGVSANSQYPYDFLIDNLQINLNILKACQKYSLNNSIFMLSGCIFPKDANNPLINEYLLQGEPHPSNYGYAHGKRILSIGSKCLKTQFNIKTSCIIPSNMYGLNDNYNLNDSHVIPGLIHKTYLAKLNNTNLEVWGSGKAQREFVFAQDVADLLKIMLDNEIPEQIIISTGICYSIEEIVTNIAKIMGFHGNIVFDKSKPEGMMIRSSHDTTINKLFPDFNFTSIEDGLNSTIEYFIKNYNLLRK